MRFSEILEAVRTALVDDESGISDDGSKAIKVLENPNRVQLQTYLKRWNGRSRLTIDKDGNLLAWDSRDAIHADVTVALGIEPRFNGFIYQDGIGFRYDPQTVQEIEPEIRANKNLIRALGNEIPIFSTDDDW